MPLDSLPARFLFRLEARTAPAVSVPDGPHGTRVLIGVEEGHFEGPGLRGRLVPGLCSEYATLRADQSIRADVRLVLETDDGASIVMTYRGIATSESGPDDASSAATMRVRTAPLFEAGAERYAWLNRIQAIGLGSPIEGGIGYDVYAIEA